ncbi:MAG: T9SS type A sorting domain-containing protein [Ignavibacteria bacterium]|jgi:hypothetical protein|nr:T9SS type A sorting domain-containing protein [Ignavibacteria bacterium]
MKKLFFIFLLFYFNSYSQSIKVERYNFLPPDPDGANWSINDVFYSSADKIFVFKGTWLVKITNWNLPPETLAGAWFQAFKKNSPPYIAGGYFPYYYKYSNNQWLPIYDTTGGFIYRFWNNFALTFPIYGDRYIAKFENNKFIKIPIPDVFRAITGQGNKIFFIGNDYGIWETDTLFSYWKNYKSVGLNYSFTSFYSMEIIGNELFIAGPGLWKGQLTNSDTIFFEKILSTRNLRFIKKFDDKIFVGGSIIGLYIFNNDLSFIFVDSLNGSFCVERINDSTFLIGGFDLYKLTFLDTTTEVEEDKAKNIFQLYQNYPNPFNLSTRIKFTLPEMTKVTLKVYNILGQEVATILENKELPLGSYDYEFNANNLASGTYIYRLVAGNFVQTKKMILIK